MKLGPSFTLPFAELAFKICLYRQDVKPNMQPVMFKLPSEQGLIGGGRPLPYPGSVLDPERRSSSHLPNDRSSKESSRSRGNV